MRINHNCCIKLVRLVIFIYDAWSHIHQTILKFIYVSISNVENVNSLSSSFGIVTRQDTRM